MTGLWKAWKAKNRLPNSFHEPLGNLAKSRRDSHISTAPAVLTYVSDRTASKKRNGKCGPWKSGNPRPGFPLSHRPDSLRQQGGKPFCGITLRAAFGGEGGRHF